MAEPHVNSDDTAILSAMDRRLEIATAAMDKAYADFKAHLVSPWAYDRAVGALKAAHYEAIADLERALFGESSP